MHVITRALARGALLSLAVAACGERAREERSTGSDDPVATLQLELEIGADIGAASEYLFASIMDIEIGDDGTIWVLDGYVTFGGSQTPMLRQFDSEGRFLRHVGREGAGPGEYRRPDALALLRDGRVALRDQGLPDRITLYTRDGAIDTTWLLGTAFRSVYNGADPIQTDTAGILWLRFNNVRPSLDRPPAKMLRLRPDGTILDSVSIPPLPEVEYDYIQIRTTLPSGGTSVRGFAVPYQPIGVRAWSPTGTFAIGRTDEYRIVILSPPGSETGQTGRVITRDVATNPVSEAERTAARAELTARVRAVEGGDDIEIPEIPAYKPLISRFRFTLDGHLLVAVRMPSAFVDDVWTETSVYDVFAPDGRYRGRLNPPDSLAAFEMRGDLLWGIHRGEHDVQSVRVYRVIWP